MLAVLAAKVGLVKFAVVASFDETAYRFHQTCHLTKPLPSLSLLTRLRWPPMPNDHRV